MSATNEFLQRIRDQVADVYGVPPQDVSINITWPGRIHVGVRMRPDPQLINLTVTGGPTPAVDVVDVLAKAASDAAQAAERELWTYEGDPVPETWRAVAQAVRDAYKPFQRPTQDAYDAATVALTHHRERSGQLAEFVREVVRWVEYEGPKRPETAAAVRVWLKRLDTIERSTPVSVFKQDQHVGFPPIPAEPPDQRYLVDQLLGDGTAVYTTWYPCDEGWVNEPPESLEPDDFGNAYTWGKLVGEVIDQGMILFVREWKRDAS